MVPEPLCRHGRRALALLAALSLPAPAQPGNAETIEQIKPSIVAVGTFERARNPQFSFAGTGFAVGDGSFVATNQHVLPKTLNTQRSETLAVAARVPGHSVAMRAARHVATDASADLALLRLDGPPLPALRLGNSERVREGETYLFTGYPLGSILGLFPVTHRTMIAAVTPIAIPAVRAAELDSRRLRGLAAGAYTVFQLDGTAYPGNSGSPVYDPQSAKVIGIVNSVYVKGTKESALTQPTGITYAIPVVKLKELLDRAR